jgi:hypothetical protein
MHWNNFYKFRPQETWSHEDASAMLLDYMVEQNNIELE